MSNRASLTAPVYNYSGVFEYMWEEMTLPIAFRDDWREAERILFEEIRDVSTESGARAAMLEMGRRFPVPTQELEPRVFIRVTDDYLQLAGRFVVSVRTARSVKDQVTRRVLHRLQEAGIGVASATVDVTVRRP